MNWRVFVCRASAARSASVSAIAVILYGLLPNVVAAEPGLIEITAEQRSAMDIQVVSLVPVEVVASPLHPARVVVPNDQVRIVAAGQPGLIETLLVAVGEDVLEGQPLVNIRSPELISTQREFLQALARLDLARGAAERDSHLVEEGIVPGRRAQESNTALAEKRARVDELRRWLELVGMTSDEIARLERESSLRPTLVVRAPIDAVVLEQMAEAGRRVDGADPLYRLGQLDPLLLELHVPIELADRVSPGDEVRIPERQASGRVIAVGRSVHPVDQGVLVRAEVREGTANLRPDQFVRAQIHVRIDTNAGDRFSIPRGTLVRSGAETFVFVEAKGGFRATPVELIGENGEGAVVGIAAEAGAKVVSRGTAALKALWLERNEAF